MQQSKSRFNVTLAFGGAVACLLYFNIAVAQALPKWLAQTDIPVAPLERVEDSASCEAIAKQAVRPSLSTSYLYEPSSNNPELVVGTYNLTDGLFAAFQSSTGKRLLFRAFYKPNGAVVAEVAHLNSSTGRVEVLVGRSRKVNDRGQVLQAFEVGGADLLKVLRDRNKHSAEGQAISDFVTSDTGRAFMEGVPALYAVLEDLEADAKLAKLQSPLGATLTAIQLMSNSLTGFESAERVVGPQRAARFRSGCDVGECQYRGAHFTVQSNGLFDILSKSKRKKALAVSGSPAQCSMVSRARSPLQTIPSIAKNGDGNCTDPGPCFGMCGPGCFTPGDISTPECFDHDFCVCKYGQAACLDSNDVENWPQDCDGCGDLVSATASFVSAILRELFGEHPTENQTWDSISGDYTWW